MVRSLARLIARGWSDSRGDADHRGMRFRHVEHDGTGGFGVGEVAGQVGDLDLHEELRALIARDVPAVQAVVLEIAGDDLPRSRCNRRLRRQATIKPSLRRRS